MLVEKKHTELYNELIAQLPLQQDLIGNRIGSIKKNAILKKSPN